MTNQFARIKTLEDNLSPAHVWYLKQRSSSEAEYLQKLEIAYREHLEAVQNMKQQR